MNEETRQLAKELRDKIATVKQYSSSTSITDIFLAAEEILACLSYLVSPLAEIEVAYRRVVLAAKNSGESMAAAEAIGKASNEYLDYRKLTLLYEQGNEAIMLLKKFKDSLELEQKRI